MFKQEHLEFIICLQRGEEELLVAEEVVREVLTHMAGKRSVCGLQPDSFGCTS